MNANDETIEHDIHHMIYFKLLFFIHVQNYYHKKYKFIDK